MCQINVVRACRGEEEELLMEGVTSLEVRDGEVVLHTFFEEPATIRGVRIDRIDFLGGKVVLTPMGEE